VDASALLLSSWVIRYSYATVIVRCVIDKNGNSRAAAVVVLSQFAPFNAELPNAIAVELQSRDRREAPGRLVPDAHSALLSQALMQGGFSARPLFSIRGSIRSASDAFRSSLDELTSDVPRVVPDGLRAEAVRTRPAIA
jgi:hypothetical protein